VNVTKKGKRKAGGEGEKKKEKTNPVDKPTPVQQWGVG
jgi:hypothetical protein